MLYLGPLAQRLEQRTHKNISLLDKNKSVQHNVGDFSVQNCHRLIFTLKFRSISMLLRRTNKRGSGLNLLIGG